MRISLAIAALLIVAVAPAQTVTMKMKFPKGDVQNSTMKMNMNMTTGMGGLGKMNMDMGMSEGARWQVLTSSPVGGTVRMTYGQSKSTMSMIMNGKKTPMPGQTGATDMLKGKSVVMHFANGRIVKVDGMKEVMAGTQKGNPMASMFSDDKSMADMMNMSYAAALPSHPVRVGDSWTAPLKFSQGPIRFDMNIRYKLAGVETRGGHRMARMNATGTGSMNMTGTGTAAPGMSMKTKRFDITGIQYFDLDRGWISDSTFKMNVQAEMSMNAQGKAQNIGMSMVMSVQTKFSMAR